MKKYTIGSNILGLENCKDKDRVIISDECDYKRVIEGDEEILYISEKTLLKNFEFKNGIYSIYNYQYDKDIIKQDFPIEYHILDYKKELIELLNKIINEKLLNFNKRITCNGGNCSKLVYHVAYNIFILKNNSPIITDEQKEIIQKIHDRKMPIEYLNELEAMFNSII